MRVACYARVSTHDQQTLPLQLKAMEEYVARRNWTIAERISEIGSGKDDNRPKREALLKKAYRREIDAILVWKLDRWGRSLADLVSTLKNLTDLKIGFISLTEAIDLTTPTGRALTGMLSVFAEFERDILRERIKAGIDQSRMNGKPHGRPRSAMSRASEIAQLHAEGVSKSKIASTLGIGRTSVRRVLEQQRVMEQSLSPRLKLPQPARKIDSLWRLDERNNSKSGRGINRAWSEIDALVAQSKTFRMPFNLPPEISFEKKELSQGIYAYEFHHKTLGGLGRVLLKDLAQGEGKQTYVGCEVAGEPDDPMTAKRLAVFDPIARRLTEELEQALGKGKGTPVTPQSSPTSGQWVLKKLMQCEKCEAFVALLIYAEKAGSLGEMEDYARMMYREVTQYNLPTWVIGPQVGTEPFLERPADILKIWPSREPVRRLRPDKFNAEIRRLQKSHC